MKIFESGSDPLIAGDFRAALEGLFANNDLLYYCYEYMSEFKMVPADFRMLFEFINYRGVKGVLEKIQRLRAGKE